MYIQFQQQFLPYSGYSKRDWNLIPLPLEQKVIQIFVITLAIILKFIFYYFFSSSSSFNFFLLSFPRETESVKIEVLHVYNATYWGKRTSHAWFGLLLLLFDSGIFNQL